MKRIALAFLSTSLLLFSLTSFAKAEVEITWQNPEKFSDVRSANESRKKFRERTFKHLNKHINELAEDLPDGQRLLMNVTNLDLAGEVLPSSFVGIGHSISDVRIIKTLYIPSMNFSYRLLTSEGVLLQEKEVKLKDMSFMERNNRFSSNETLHYEKNMFTKWFEDEFPNLVASK